MESNTFYDIYLEELKNLRRAHRREETALLKKLTEGQDSGFPSDGVKTGDRRFGSRRVPRSGGLPGDPVRGEQIWRCFCSQASTKTVISTRRWRKRCARQSRMRCRFRTAGDEDRGGRWRRVLMSSKDISASMARELDEATLAELAGA